MEQPAVITVRGTGTVRRRPDVALLHVGIEAAGGRLGALRSITEGTGLPVPFVRTMSLEAGMPVPPPPMPTPAGESAVRVDVVAVFALTFDGD